MLGVRIIYNNYKPQVSFSLEGKIKHTFKGAHITENIINKTLHPYAYIIDLNARLPIISTH